MTPQSDTKNLWTQEQFNKMAAAVYATIMAAVLVGVFWLFGQLDFVAGCVSAFSWMQIYRTCGGDPLNYAKSAVEKFAQ